MCRRDDSISVTHLVVSTIDIMDTMDRPVISPSDTKHYRRHSTGFKLALVKQTSLAILSFLVFEELEEHNFYVPARRWRIGR
jgi:hypothetical protein